ncbi:MAG TPA: NAD(P)H-hydrate dehydratase [Oscillatoriaceae cyanobacterium M33_DOE_052]|uniref:Bifunctional NAD(P)H-hydrate repair enzyme n=1 Tax=Planktothricoides sp. SpSt-374 TaxID=2282167 RepID=A0A7C3ZTG8_9CYAN|nr:NAD(P)H-hydrate dehydratase [Oscillatoriaceae cyanobacterium M33_DOE_052]
MTKDKEQIHQIIVTAAQMRAIETRVFDAGMPVAALMEKVAGMVARRIQELYPHPQRVGFLVGPGHNGGDALVVARELHFQGYPITIYSPFAKFKELTGQHARYLASLGFQPSDDISILQKCDLIIDGLFGFGLEKPLTEPIATAINQINQLPQPILSIDIPSGLHTDTGEVLGASIRANRTFCLGLWKLGELQDQALEYIGIPELIDFDLPLADIEAVLGNPAPIRRITPKVALTNLPLPRAVAGHKYQFGHLLLICGSRQYAGAAILAGLGARATGVGMLSIAVPESIKPILHGQLPEALIIGCPETATGAISHLPANLDLHSYDTIACGPGITTAPQTLIKTILHINRPLILDADALNIMAQLGETAKLLNRQFPTIITPHPGEFKRLFPHLAASLAKNRVEAAQIAATESNTVVVLKGARVVISHPDTFGGDTWINPHSTPALARGGSGDVLTGLLGGLIAQSGRLWNPESSTQAHIFGSVQTAVWWHARAGKIAAGELTELGVDPLTLTKYLLPAISQN